MLSCAMIYEPSSRRRYARLSSAEQDALIDDFERGIGSRKELAARYGVHLNSLRNIARTRGAVYGSRAHETVAELVAVLDERDRIAAHAKVLDDIERLDRFNANMDMIGQFMAAMVQADRDGRLVEFGRAAGLVRRRPLGIRRRSHTGEPRAGSPKGKPLSLLGASRLHRSLQSIQTRPHEDGSSGLGTSSSR